jgi:hypothetical protein
MRIYEISRSVKGVVRCMVRSTEGQGETLPARRLRHANLHSPTGFECGYGGSGPADLAASILADFFNVAPRTVAAAWRGKPARKPHTASRTADAGKVVGLHQDFKAEVISRIQLGRGEKKEITGEQIAVWLAGYGATPPAEAEIEPQ